MELKLNVKERHNSIYLIYLSTFGNTGQKVYKFGKTYNCLNRFRGYPRDSTLLFFERVIDCHHVERVISDVFKEKFVRRMDIGLEYFEGDPKTMIEYINQIIDHMKQRKERNILKSVEKHYDTYLRFTIYDRDKIPDNLSDILLDNYKDEGLSVMKKSGEKQRKVIKKLKYKDEELSMKDKLKRKHEKEIKKINFKEGILLAADIDDDQYNKYMDMYRENIESLRQDEILSVEKYLFMRIWKIDEIDKDFVDKWYDKTYIIYNLKLLKYGETQDGLISLTNSKKRSNNKKAKYIKDFIETLGFTLNNIGKNNIKSREVFDANKEKCYKSSKIYKKEKAKTLFDIKISKFETNKAFMGFVNYLLQQYGLCIKTIQKRIYNKVTKEKSNEYYYHIDYLQEIDKYL